MMQLVVKSRISCPQKQKWDSSSIFIGQTHVSLAHDPKLCIFNGSQNVIWNVL